jgi:hypothetical protein
MNKRSIPRIASILAFFLALFLASCEPATTATSGEATGSLLLSASMPGAIADSAGASSEPSRTSVPTGVDLSTLSYSLSLTSSSSSASPISGGVSSSGDFETVSMIPIGSWIATVTAVASGVTVGTGSATVVIAAESTTTATIDLVPPAEGDGNVALSCTWSFLATPTVVITPVNPTGTQQTISSPTMLTSFSTSIALAAGLYHVSLSLSTTDGTTTTIQSGASETVYVLSGRTTNLGYAFAAASYKLPSVPSMAIRTGYNATTLNYAYVSWSGAARTTSYTLERKSASTQVGLDSAAYPATPLASGLAANAFGYTDNTGGAMGLVSNLYYRYRLTASNAAGSVQTTVDTTNMYTISLVTTIGGTCNFSVPSSAATTGTFLANTAIRIALVGGLFTNWIVTPTNGVVLSLATSYSPTAILYSNATITAY